MSRSRVPRLLALGILPLLVACARPVSIGTDPGPTYAVEVRNALPEDMIVSYDAGGGPAVLGTVRASSSERFVITSRTTTSITISASNAARTRTSGPYRVQLEAGTTPQVTLR